MVDGKLKPSCSTDEGYVFFQSCLGIFLQCDRTRFKALGYARYVLFVGSQVFWAAVGEVRVDRGDRVPEHGSGQRVQNERSVRPVALWVHACTHRNEEYGQVLQGKWDPKLAPNLWKKAEDSGKERRPSEEKVDEKQGMSAEPDAWARELWGSKEKVSGSQRTNNKWITENEYGQLIFEEWKFSENCVVNSEGKCNRKNRAIHDEAGQLDRRPGHAHEARGKGCGMRKTQLGEVEDVKPQDMMMGKQEVSAGQSVSHVIPCGPQFWEARGRGPVGEERGKGCIARR